jgi:site-specific recombinase XerD|nr:MAG TPA: SITE SPECIFIC RECOMBINASE XERD [Caudoviricetes sp.]
MTKDEIKVKLDEWINQQRLDEYAKKTLTDYRHGVDLFINWIKDDPFAIDKNLMLDYKDYLEVTFALNSRNKYIVEINKFLKYCGYKDCTLKKFKTQRKTSIDDPIWEQEHKRMLRWAKKLDMEDMYFILEIFAYTGCRVDELKFFTVESLDSNYIKKVYNKGKERTIILRNDLKRALKDYCKRMGITTGYIFISTSPKAKPGAMWDNSTIWRRLKRIAKAAKINPAKIHPHAWRHLFAKKAKEAGIDLDELQDILGHADIKTTAIYTQTSNREKKAKIEKIKYGKGQEYE